LKINFRATNRTHVPLIKNKIKYYLIIVPMKLPPKEESYSGIRKMFSSKNLSYSYKIGKKCELNRYKTN
jgi:hypothetical protein